MDVRVRCRSLLVKIVTLTCFVYLADASCKTTRTCQLTYATSELRKRLSPLAYHVTQEDGTERPFTGELLYNKKNGSYRCAVCDNVLFSSDTKYNSGTGWPSFYDVVDKNNIDITLDTKFGWVRQEVSCSRCGAHLGHVFDDGPRPTGKRYCINSVALMFHEQANV